MNHGPLTTHVLDTMHGCPAAGMQVRLYRFAEDGTGTLVTDFVLDDDGRAPQPLLPLGGAVPGRYRLQFEVAAYFRARGVSLPDPPFLDSVPVDFGMVDRKGHYHVPLLTSPWAYSTYRGS